MSTVHTLTPRQGHPRAVWSALRDHGSYARQGRRRLFGCDGLVRAARARNGDSCQCGERGERVHGRVHQPERKGASLRGNTSTITTET
jgi:hypothetical protein